ncbi:UNVERIFIED_CONTAM: hypothetical protein GTU68_045108 [Idotea baltica]|nr:hypothetical protein [Idotea baltica]
MNPNLPKPFKRYQIQPVWRADRPQPRQGRFREFYQCDIDAVGSKSMMCDAEIIAIKNDILTALGFTNFVIKISNRKILNGMVQYAGLDASFTQDICRSIDKLDKISFEEVAKEMRDKEINEEAILKLKSLIYLELNADTQFDQLATLFEGIDLAQEGLKELKELFAFLEVLGVPAENIKFDISLARGLDYYTGPIFETKLKDYPHIGSLTGGGRYDELIGTLSGQDLPAVGSSLGLDRIFTAMQQVGLIDGALQTRTKVLFINFSDTIIHSMKLATQLRQSGINVEVYPTDANLKRQFGYADKKNIPFTVVIGEQEVNDGIVSFKNMETGEQQKITIEEVITILSDK